MGEVGAGPDETGARDALTARLQAVVEREVERQHGALLEQLRHLEARNTELERDNRKLKLRSDTIDETLRQLRQGTTAVYYDSNGMRVDPFAEVGA